MGAIKKIYIKNEDTRFIVRLVASSLVLFFVVANAVLLISLNTDSVQSTWAKLCARSGDYEQALDTAEKISDSDIRTELKYAIGEQMYADSEYAAAEEIFRELGNYSASEEYTKKCAYATADELFKAGDYDAAIVAFATLGDFSDSMTRQKESVYMKAELALADEDYSKASSYFILAGNYKDAADRAMDAAMVVTGGDRGLAEILLTSGGMTEEEVNHSVEIVRAHTSYGEGTIDAGAYHTVVLMQDGTVKAFGDNTYGQCDVGSWRDIVAVCAGARHTVGLKSDGTVVAVGRNVEGQCNVADWSDIAQIAANNSSTLALTSDGKVLSCGFQDYANLKNAVDVSKIYAGSYGALAETASGLFLTSHNAYAIAPERSPLQVSLGTGYCITLSSSGECTSDIEEVVGWKDIVCVDAGSNAAIAADLSGKVFAHFFRTTDKLDFSSAANVCQCAAGTEHYVFLTTDGEVLAYGDNTYGQCDASGLNIND